jgi:hypothetical protein
MRSWLALCALPLLLTSPARGQDDTEGPLIDHEPVAMTVTGKPLLIVATFTDDNGVFEPAVLYRVGGEGTFVSIPMQATGEGATYAATIPGDIVVAKVEYFIEAFDELGNGPTREGDPDLPLVVRVVAPDVESPPDDRPDNDDGIDGTDGQQGGDDGGEAEEGSSLPLILGVGGAAGGAAIVAVAAAAAGGAAAYYFLVLNGGNNTPSQVTVTVSSPSPTASALMAGAP